MNRNDFSTIKKAQPTDKDLRKLLRCIDYTRLDEKDDLLHNKETITTFCKQASTPYGQVAAVCLYPKFLPIASPILTNEHIALACVVNFPHGKDDWQTIEKVLQFSIEHHADEIDLVFPYADYLAGKTQNAFSIVAQARALLGKQTTLKVILETGLLQANQIQVISETLIHLGVDFLKTSTGKINQGASLEAAAIMLSCIAQSNTHVGFKASGGIQTAEDAWSYYQLASKILGIDWVNATHFRIGASRLLANILQKLNHHI